MFGGMRLRVGIPLAVVAALVCACAAQPRQKSAGTPERASASKPYDFRSEGKVPPPDAAPVEPDVEEMPMAGERVEVSEADVPPPPPPDTTAVLRADSTTDGFRIQVFATGDREVAENAASVAQQRLGLAAYTDLEAGMYKIRVGDYLRRPDAEAALKTFRSHYYPDAWIVPARIRVPRNP
jgi:hypothetical protein